MITVGLTAVLWSCHLHRSMRGLVEGFQLRSVLAHIVTLHSGAAVGIHLDTTTITYTLTVSHLLFILPRARHNQHIAVQLEVHTGVHLDGVVQNLFLKFLWIHCFLNFG